MLQLNLTAFPFGPSTIIKLFDDIGCWSSATVRHVLLTVIASDDFMFVLLSYPPTIKIVLEISFVWTP